MANKSFVIQYLIKARDGFSAAAGKAEKGLRKFRDAAQKTRRSLIRLSKESKDALKKMAAGVLTFATVSVGAMLKVGSGYQTALADLSAITGKSGAELDRMSAAALRLGVDSVTSQEQVVTAFKLIASAKSDLLDVEGGVAAVTKEVLTLKNAAGVDLALAADIVTNSLNQFGVGADQAARFVNVLAAGSKIGASEVADTGAALAKVGKVADLAGIPFEELNAAIQVLAQNSQKSEIAGTGMKTMLIRLEEKLGNMAPSVVGLSASLEFLASKNLSLTQKTKLFGSEAVAIGAILIDNVAKVKKWTGALTGTNIAQEQAAKNTATFTKKLEKIKIMVEGALIKTFLKLEPTLSKLADDFAVWLGALDEEKIDSFTSSLLAVFNALAAIGGIVGGVFKAVGAVGSTLGEGFAALVTGDFSQSSAGTFAAAAPVETLKAPTASTTTTKVDVGVQVGLDAGLQQSAPTVIGGAGAGRADVGGN